MLFSHCAVPLTSASLVENSMLLCPEQMYTEARHRRRRESLAAARRAETSGDAPSPNATLDSTRWPPELDAMVSVLPVLAICAAMSTVHVPSAPAVPWNFVLPS